MSSWFCCDELGSKRAPIPYSSIFPLAATRQQALLCAAWSIQGVCTPGSVGQIQVLKFQTVEMSEKLQTTFWTLLMYSPWTSGNQKCMTTGNTIWNYYFFKGDLKQTTKCSIWYRVHWAIFSSVSNLLCCRKCGLHDIFNKIQKEKKKNIKSYTDSPATSVALTQTVTYTSFVLSKSCYHLPQTVSGFSYFESRPKLSQKCGIPRGPLPE